MDEISLGAATLVGELKNGEISEYEIHPEDFGLRWSANRGLGWRTPNSPSLMLRGAGQPCTAPARDIVILNAGAALYAANVAA